jgi:hypothetical protein
MHRIKKASSNIFIAGCLILAATVPLRQAESQPASSAAAVSLDYGFFKDKVQPVFLAKRAGHTRCVVCHTINNAPFHLVPLSPGATSWNEQQSRQNFELVQKVAAPGFLESPLIKHPLAQEAGGDPHHGGAQQFSSQENPEWLTLKAFVLGEKVK